MESPMSDQNMLAQIKEAFLEDEPEWAEGFLKQESAMTKKEAKEYRPKLDEIFWRLTSEEVDSEDIKGEIESIFQHLRTERRKAELKEQILPLVKSLPRELHQSMLTDVLDLFGDLGLSDQEVIDQAKNIISASLRRMGVTPPEPQRATTEEPRAPRGEQKRPQNPEPLKPDSNPTPQTVADGEKKKKKKKKDQPEADGEQPHTASEESLNKKKKKDKKPKNTDEVSSPQQAPAEAPVPVETASVAQPPAPRNRPASTTESSSAPSQTPASSTSVSSTIPADPKLQHQLTAPAAETATAKSPKKSKKAEAAKPEDGTSKQQSNPPPPPTVRAEPPPEHAPPPASGSSDAAMKNAFAALMDAPPSAAATTATTTTVNTTTHPSEPVKASASHVQLPQPSATTHISDSKSMNTTQPPASSSVASPPAPAPSPAPAAHVAPAAVVSGEAKSLLSAANLLVAQFRAAQLDTNSQLELQWHTLEQREALLQEREDQLLAREDELAAQTEEQRIREEELSRMEAILLEQRKQCAELLQVIRDRDVEQDSVVLLREQMDTALTACEDAMQKSAAAAVQLVEKQRLLTELQQRESDLSKELGDAQLIAHKAEVHVQVMTEELSKQAAAAAEYKAQSEALSAKLQELAARLEDRRPIEESFQEMTQKLQDLGRLQSRNAELEAQIEGFQRDLKQREVWSRYADELEAKLKVSRSEASQNKSDVLRLSQDNQRLTIELEELRKTAQNLESQVLRYREDALRLRAVEEEMLCRRHEVGEILERCHAKDSHLRRTAKAVSRLKKQLNEKESQLASFTYGGNGGAPDTSYGMKFSHTTATGPTSSSSSTHGQPPAPVSTHASTISRLDSFDDVETVFRLAMEIGYHTSLCRMVSHFLVESAAESSVSSHSGTGFGSQFVRKMCCGLASIHSVLAREARQLPRLLYILHCRSFGSTSDRSGEAGHRRSDTEKWADSRFVESRGLPPPSTSASHPQPPYRNQTHPNAQPSASSSSRPPAPPTPFPSQYNAPVHHPLPAQQSSTVPPHHRNSGPVMAVSAHQLQEKLAQNNNGGSVPPPRASLLQHRSPSYGSGFPSAGSNTSIASSFLTAGALAAAFSPTSPDSPSGRRYGSLSSDGGDAGPNERERIGPASAGMPRDSRRVSQFSDSLDSEPIPLPWTRGTVSRDPIGGSGGGGAGAGAGNHHRPR